MQVHDLHRIASGSTETYIEKLLLLFACRRICASKLLSYNFSLTGIQEQIFPEQGYYARLTVFFPPLFFILQLGSTLFKTSLMLCSACQLGKMGSSFFVQQVELLISLNTIFSFLNKRQMKYCSVTSRIPDQRTIMSLFLVHDFKLKAILCWRLFPPQHVTVCDLRCQFLNVLFISTDFK